ncbi:MAG: D-2-hydroxyacid dehydrogenase [Calditrichaeota bacterium]|nr:MAG: D-2-hydroxyacid dehydrogenase [Calditrichota bacterium]MBL1204627.1 D-2-hydroxyacid dehydrogenase [Calditrichota bacterium]NOG44456.1 D-2-hydroxyacid dehydrogenase [Calditrichota bacterium]
MNKKKIVILDGYTLNPGDLSWQAIQELGECSIYERTNESDILKRAINAQIILTNKTPLTKSILKKLPNLELIVVTATGVNIVDIDAARSLNIPVANVPAYGVNSVAQMVFAHILNLTQHVSHHNKTIKDGRWTNSKDWSYWDFPLLELAEKKMGIIGYGQIGQKVAQIARAFGMDVLINTRRVVKNYSKEFKQVNLEELFKQSDVISLHCPLTNETNHLINNISISKMKKSVLLINTSRGGLINEKDLQLALNEERISGAGLDVLSSEPPTAENPLLTAKNCYITPHIAWATKEARQRLLDIVIENIKSFIDEKPKNIVN